MSRRCGFSSEKEDLYLLPETFHSFLSSLIQSAEAVRARVQQAGGIISGASIGRKKRHRLWVLVCPGLGLTSPRQYTDWSGEARARPRKQETFQLSTALSPSLWFWKLHRSMFVEGAVEPACTLLLVEGWRARPSGNVLRCPVLTFPSRGSVTHVASFSPLLLF